MYRKSDHPMHTHTHSKRQMQILPQLHRTQTCQSFETRNRPFPKVVHIPESFFFEPLRGKTSSHSTASMCALSLSLSLCNCYDMLVTPTDCKTPSSETYNGPHSVPMRVVWGNQAHGRSWWASPSPSSPHRAFWDHCEEKGMWRNKARQVSAHMAGTAPSTTPQSAKAGKVKLLILCTVEA